MKKILIIITNILIIIVLFFALEYLIYSLETKEEIQTNNNPFTYNIINPDVMFNNLKMDDYTFFRKPDGLDYSNKPITIFGCSVGYGQHLNQDETLGHVLSEETKRPVYNRSIIGAGLQQMLYQTRNEKFYDAVPPSRDIIYVFIPNHYRRMLGLPYKITDRYMIYSYKYRLGELIPNNYKNYFLNFINTSYTINYLRDIFYRKYQQSPKHINRLSDEALQYFVQSRAELQKHTNRAFNFYVLIFQRYNGDLYFRKILEDNGFKVIFIDELTSEDLKQPKYLASDNLHPSAKVWKLITPELSKKIQ